MKKMAFLLLVAVIIGTVIFYIWPESTRVTEVVPKAELAGQSPVEVYKAFAEEVSQAKNFDDLSRVIQRYALDEELDGWFSQVNNLSEAAKTKGYEKMVHYVGAAADDIVITKQVIENDNAILWVTNKRANLIGVHGLGRENGTWYVLIGNFKRLYFSPAFQSMM
jgi:hypothetical protein